jgi:hypothetical protein
MELLVQATLKKTERESKMKETVGAALQGLLSLKDLIGSALETIPRPPRRKQMVMASSTSSPE